MRSFYEWKYNLTTNHTFILFILLYVEYVWWKKDHNDLKNLPRSLEKHEKSKTYLSSACKLTVFRQQKIVSALNTTRKVETENYNNSTSTSKMIQDVLIESITHVLKEIIDDEITYAKFLSWEVDETIDISCFAQLSVIMKFVKKSQVFEKFLKLFWC